MLMLGAVASGKASGAASASAMLAIVGLKNLLNIIVTCLSDHITLWAFCPLLARPCVSLVFFARINAFNGFVYVDLLQQPRSLAWQQS
ncbi:hypothetical protein [Lentibacter sp.]|uniref:hypothetical protein n=1 Tax=Lentibacter sp. TaxID=2024994 RepID=UPI003F6A4EB2